MDLSTYVDKTCVYGWGTFWTTADLSHSQIIISKSWKSDNDSRRYACRFITTKHYLSYTNLNTNPNPKTKQITRDELTRNTVKCEPKRTIPYFSNCEL